MGVAYHNIRSRNRGGGVHSVLYPCFGLKSKGDRISIRRGSWLSIRGLGQGRLLSLTFDSISMLQTFNDFAANESSLSEEMGRSLYDCYTRNIGKEDHVVVTRPGLEIVIDIKSSVISPVAYFAGRPFRAGDSVRSRQGLCRVIAVTPNKMWYTVESSNLGAWFWTPSDFQSLLSEGDCLVYDQDGGGASNSDVNSEVEAPILTINVFMDCLLETWTESDSGLLVRFVNQISERYDLNPAKIPYRRILGLRKVECLLPDKSDAAILCRYTLLTVLSRAALNALPLIDLGKRCSPLLLSDLERNQSVHYKPPGAESSSSSRYADVYHHIKEYVFTRTKQTVWGAVMQETVTPTAAPGDEFDRPEDITEVNLNRLESKILFKSSNTIPFADRLDKSVVGQLMSKLSHLDDRDLRRCYADTMDDGQSTDYLHLLSQPFHKTALFVMQCLARAFFVKLTGEGADDHGGPYRAVFQTTIGEEAEHLLELVVPCANAINEVGENRDKVILNPLYSNEIAKLSVIEFLGKLLGLACRNNILVDINLASLVWKPLVNDEVYSADFYAFDAHLSRALEWAMTGESDDDLLLQMLTQALSITSADSLLRTVKSHMKSNSFDLSELILHLKSVQLRSLLAFFYKGLGSILPSELFAIFTAEELETVFCGQAILSVELLKEATIYESVSPTDR